MPANPLTEVHFGRIGNRECAPAGSGTGSALRQARGPGTPFDTLGNRSHPVTDSVAGNALGYCCARAYTRRMRSSAIDTVLALMRAFHEQDRAAAEALIHADFVFTSPQDDHLDRAAWFERCFPSAGHFDAPSVTLQIIESDGIVLHRYEYLVDGTTFRNVEATRVVDGAVREVEVYFGGAV